MGSTTIPEKLYDIAIFIAAIIASVKYIKIIVLKEIVIGVLIISIVLTIISIIKLAKNKKSDNP